jgi:peptide deformylase
MIDASQRMIAVNNQVQGEAREEGWGINPVIRNKDASKCSNRCK